MSLLRKFLNFYIYSSLHIAIAAAALVFQCFLIIDLEINIQYLLFIFCSTILLYSIHRLIGIKKSGEYQNLNRYSIIIEYKYHILIYAIITAGFSVYYFYVLDLYIKLLIVLPALISLLYTLPVLNGYKRLRDFNYIKIFLISLVWAISTFAIPALLQKQMQWPQILLFLERFSFVFAITVPFDIRDADIDSQSKVKTLVHLLGIENSYSLSKFILGIAWILNISAFLIGIISFTYIVSITIFYGITMGIILLIKGKKSDIYYAGILDGTMILFAVFAFIALRIMS